MKRNVLICIVGVILTMLLGLKIGWDIHRPKDCPDCPEFVPLTHSERDSSVRQPTVELIVPTKGITSSTKYVPVFHRPGVADSVTAATVTETLDTLNCWNIPAQAPDSASIVMHLCSRSLSVQPPADLSPTVEYTASPRVRIIERVNNVALPCPQPRRWGMTIGPYVGAGVNVFGKPQAQVGIGLCWGYRIKAQ